MHPPPPMFDACPRVAKRDEHLWSHHLISSPPKISNHLFPTATAQSSHATYAFMAGETEAPSSHRHRLLSLISPLSLSLPRISSSAPPRAERNGHCLLPSLPSTDSPPRVHAGKAATMLARLPGSLLSTSRHRRLVELPPRTSSRGTPELLRPELKPESPSPRSPPCPQARAAR